MPTSTPPTAETAADSPSNRWTQGATAPLHISGLTNRGDGIGHLDGRAVFVPDTVPGDDIEVRLVRVKPSYGFGKVHHVIQPSPHRIRPSCIVADKCGGCQWQLSDYESQLAAKETIVRDALHRIGHVDIDLTDPILAAPSTYHYRNKSTYPITSSPSNALVVGYYQRGSHRAIDLNQCPVQDHRLDEVLQAIKHELRESGWPAYNEQRHKGLLRHLGLRIGRRTGQILVTLVLSDQPGRNIRAWAEQWLERMPQIMGICANINPKRTNAIFGPETVCLAGRPALQEEFAGLTLFVDSASFFQVYTEQAELMLEWILDRLNLQGDERVVDAYCGIGTLTLPLAQQTKFAIGIESLPAAVTKARGNAQYNSIRNVEFLEGKVEAILPDMEAADLVMLDPPRKGCDAQVLAALCQKPPRRLVYISCNPSTLARDLKTLIDSNCFRIDRLRAADFFPQTSHVEVAAILSRQ